MMEKKWAMAMLLAVSSALAMGVGCGGSDDDENAGDGDGDSAFTCASLCAESGECGTEEDCLAECAEASEGCPDEVEAYLECADGGDITCFPDTSLGIVVACTNEALAIQACAVPAAGGAGGAGGD